MFCTKCGTKLEDGVSVCPGCGASVRAASEPGREAAPETDEKTAGAKAAPETASVDNGKQLPSKKFLIAGIAAAVILIAIVAAVMLQPKKINLEQFVSVSYSGYEGHGTPRADLDINGLYMAILEAQGKKVDEESIASWSALGSAIKDGVDIGKCIDTVELTVTPDGGLSNGDQVTVTITYDNDVVKKQKIEFTGKTMETTVEGLETVEVVDAFDGLAVTFEGTAPNGRADYQYKGNSSYIDTYAFSIDKRDGLRNGDTVTVTINADDEYTMRYGYVVSEKEKQFTVSGLEEYVESYSDLTDAFLDGLRAEAEDTIYSYTAGSYNDGTALSDLAYAGYIFSTVKNGIGYDSDYNNLYLIYSGTVSDTDGDFRTSKVYYPVRFLDLMNGADGIRYRENRGITGDSHVDGSYHTNGYANPLICYMDIVESNRDNYTSECGDGFEKFADCKQIASLADISDVYKEELHRDAKDRIESYIASSYESSFTVSGLAAAGEYLLLAKTQGTDYGNNNKYFVIYSANVTSEDDAFPPTTVYFPVEYDGIVSLPDEEYMVTKAAGIIGNAPFPDSYYGTQGYVDGKEMYGKLVTVNRDLYTYEVSEGLKEFGE